MTLKDYTVVLRQVDGEEYQMHFQAEDEEHAREQAVDAACEGEVVVGIKPPPVVPHDFRAIAIDETRYYAIAPEDAPSIKRILQVYVYDASQHTYCCEITPSYYLDPLYTIVEVGADVSDAERDALQEKYGYEPADACYFHCHVIEAMEKAHPDLCARWGVSDADDWARVDGDPMEHVREYWQANCPL